MLDLTRVLAGPVATRFLAGFGADVLRIDPPDWNEAPIEPEVTLGKTCARLDLRQDADRATFEALLAGADVLVHGYRPGPWTGSDTVRRPGGPWRRGSSRSASMPMAGPAPGPDDAASTASCR